MLRKAAIITLVGFLAVFLAGPVLTVAGVLLPFALVGLLVWIPFRAFMLWRQGGLEAVQASTKRGFGRILAVPVWLLATAFGGVRWIVGTAFSLIGFVLGLILPTLLGGVGGAVLGFLGGMEHHDADFRVPAGALIGAGIGLLAGAMRSRSPKRIVVIRHIPEPVRSA
ncbi:MAG TPA: hypothetical protein VGY58_22640 [Gemmataceae bacterium]|jgi:hypothetical protein|nr:hypothetical protein [Gemmataceae bacterium]